jgi:hypothetical protein
MVYNVAGEDSTTAYFGSTSAPMEYQLPTSFILETAVAVILFMI